MAVTHTKNPLFFYPICLRVFTAALTKESWRLKIFPIMEATVAVAKTTYTDKEV